MNRVFRELPPNIHAFVYADDILVVTSGSTIARTRIRAQVAVNAVVKWADSAGFELSAAKSIRCHVCPSGHQNRGTFIRIRREAIPTKNAVRVLGVVIDRRLSFKQHFDAVRDACKSRLNIIRTISRPHRTNNRRIRLRVAAAIIDSRLLYGLELTILAKERLLLTLTPIFNSYVRTVSGLLPSTPADSACVEAGILPFRFRVDTAVATRAASYAAKTAGNSRVCLLAEGDRALVSAASRGLPPIAKCHWLGNKGWHLPAVRVENKIKRQFKAGTNNEALRRSVAEMIRGKYAGCEVRYTDGSKSSSGVGVGVSGANSEVTLSSSLPEQCSVFSAEAMAIFHAATRPATKPLLIVSDSQSVISALQSEEPDHPWVQATIRYAPLSTTYAWVPGHSGIPGNNEADFLAGAGTSGPRAADTVPLKDAKRWIASIIWNAWQAEWASTRGPLTRTIKRSVEPWEDRGNWREQRAVSRLRTGHTRLSHSFGGGAFRRTCEVCSLPATVEHVLNVCPQYQHARECYGVEGSIDSTLGDDEARITSLVVFLKEADLFYNI